MSDERKFKFVSPGVFVDEIDNSQLPALPEPIGPIIIGRAQKGPSFLETLSPAATIAETSGALARP